MKALRDESTRTFFVYLVSIELYTVAVFPYCCHEFSELSEFEKGGIDNLLFITMEVASSAAGSPFTTCVCVLASIRKNHNHVYCAVLF